MIVEQRPTLGSWDPSYERKAVALLAIGFGLVGLDRWVIAPLFPVMAEDLGLSYGDLGLITGVLAAFWGVFSIISGALSDRVGRRRVLVPAMVAFSLLAGFTGLAVGLVSLLVIRSIMGAFEGAFTPTSIAATSEASKPSRRGFNMGTQQSLFALLGLGFGPIIATQLLAFVPSWHWVFVIVALPGLIVAYLLHRVIREPAHTDTSLAAEQVVGHRTERLAWGEIFKYRNVTLGTLALFGVFSGIFVISALVPSYLTDFLGLSVQQMGLVTSAIGFGGFVGYILVPGLSDRVGRKVALSTSFVIAAVFLLLFARVGATPVLLFALLFVIAICTFGNIALLAGPITTEAVPASLIASAVAIPIGAGEIFGGGIMPVIGGVLADAFGIQNMLYVALFGLLVGLAISFLLKETAPVKVGREPEVHDDFPSSL
jgi:MFS family permease